MVGGRILRDTSFPSPSPEASPVRVINAATLNQEAGNDYFYREIDEYLPNPIAHMSTDADQVLHAGSSTPTVVPSSTEGNASQSVNEQGEDSGALPTFIENSLLVSFTDTQLWDFKEYFSIPNDVGIRVPIEG
ncbi:hypothetical protein LIER_34602 [Lithospermum erythrorhizon]|uniref:Uncharacterized protein n=1 Tax=Lithospermum erythrorhizon TaxID=34254 RepID=A0AAV3S0R9_LITER